MYKEFIYKEEKIIINLINISYIELYKVDNEYRLEFDFVDTSTFGLVFVDNDITDLNCLYEEIKKELCK